MRMPLEPSDEELLRRMTIGDRAAFELLYDRRQPPVYRFALRMTGSPTLANDITQDVFLDLMRDKTQFDPERGTLAGYLFGMTRHRVLRILSKERLSVPISNGSSESSEPSYENMFVTEDVPLQDLLQKERVDAVRLAVLALPPHYREVVVLCNLHELSYDETASIVGCPVGTVRSRLNRARAILAERLSAFQSSTVRCDL